jgi:hypothetical protein
MRSTILARRSSEHCIANPRQELATYLTAPLEDVGDVVRWWGVSYIHCIDW